MTERQRDREIGRQKDRKTERHSDIQTKNREIERQRNE